MRQTKAGTMTAVGALNPDLQFVSDSQDVQAIKDSLAGRVNVRDVFGDAVSAEGYDAFFVRVQDGDYTEVWGICGIVPYNTKLTTRLV